MTDTTLNQVKRDYIPNPTGKGGFSDNPQNIGPGTWKKTETFRYWFNVFKEMSVKELNDWESNNPEETRSVASDLAYIRVTRGRDDLKEFQEVANRSEGLPTQTVEYNNVSEKYEKYLEKCKKHGINPATGLRMDDGSSQVEKG